jgi:hypothetical protein
MSFDENVGGGGGGALLGAADRGLGLTVDVGVVGIVELLDRRSSQGRHTGTGINHQLWADLLMTSIRLRRAIAVLGLLGALAVPAFVLAASSSASGGAPSGGSQNGSKTGLKNSSISGPTAGQPTGGQTVPRGHPIPQQHG